MPDVTPVKIPSVVSKAIEVFECLILRLGSLKFKTTPEAAGVIVAFDVVIVSPDVRPVNISPGKNSFTVPSSLAISVYSIDVRVPLAG